MILENDIINIVQVVVLVNNESGCRRDDHLKLVSTRVTYTEGIPDR